MKKSNLAALVNKGFKAEQTTSFQCGFECCTFDHSDNSPGIKLFFADFGNWREKHARKIEIYKNSNLETLVNQGFHAEQTTNTEYGFECCTFDHSDNSP